MSISEKIWQNSQAMDSSLKKRKAISQNLERGKNSLGFKKDFKDRLYDDDKDVLVVEILKLWFIDVKD
jgi:hypothetical protein